MLSITETKRRLPNEFIEDLYTMFSPGTVDKILMGVSEKRATTLRVNTLKSDIQQLMKLLKEENIKFERIPWYTDALILKNATEKEIQKLKLYEEGKIYLQSLSSMIPPLVLQPKQGENVLDLTAAPGSKTSQMVALMQNTGSVLANELDKIRCERLVYNIENQGVKIATVINGRGEVVGTKYPECFDKVLLDTPCSGEGRFLAGVPQTYRSWSEKTVVQLVKMQKKLLQSAYHALKPGGTLVYSTCTINKQENEYILNWALENLNLKMMDITMEIKDAIPAFTQEVDNSISKAIRVVPSKTMEGFFVGKMLKQ